MRELLPGTERSPPEQIGYMQVAVGHAGQGRGVLEEVNGLLGEHDPLPASNLR